MSAMNGPRVLIVGAGAIGLACALRLAAGGARVTVLEAGARESRRQRASAAAAGMLGPLSEALHRHDQAHPAALELALASYDAWRGDPLWACAGAAHGGALLVGANAREAAALAQARARAAETLTRAAVTERFGLRLAAREAVFVADEGVLDPGFALGALAARVRDLGGVINYGAPVVQIAAGAPARALGADGELWRGDLIVLAPGAWAAPALIAAAPALGRIYPAAGSARLARMSKALCANIRGDSFYLAARGGEEAVLGASMTFGSRAETPDAAALATLAAAAEAALPGQTAPSAAPAWAGVRAMSPDWSPMIGRSGACVVACGHSRNGWLLAPITAEIVGALVFETPLSPLWAAFGPERFDSA
ncbi:MAG: NAD(P)/FAD-dependent oxidoreductase [Hyphomonadaceae bacterium]